MTLLEALQRVETILCRAHSNLAEALKVMGDAKKAVDAALQLNPPPEITSILNGVKATLCFQYNEHHTANMAIVAAKSEVQLAIMQL